MAPKLVISLDYEKGWGLNDTNPSLREQRLMSLVGERDVVTRILELAEEHGLSITWAAVGAIGFEGPSEFKRFIRSPSYTDNDCFDIPFTLIDRFARCFFDGSSIEKIIKSPTQELGLHSFHHGFYAGRPRAKEHLQVEIRDSKAVLSKYINAANIVTYIYPRNFDYGTDILYAEGITHVRLKNRNSLEKKFDGRLPKRVVNSWRFFREIADASGHFPTTRDDRLKQTYGDIFIRFNLPDALWCQQLRILKRSLGELAPNEVLHLWWHPSNLVPKDALKLARLTALFELLGTEIRALGVESVCIRHL